MTHVVFNPPAAAVSRQASLLASVIASPPSCTLHSSAPLALPLIPPCQDEVRKVGGIAILTSLLSNLLRPGIVDIYQLRVSE